MRRSVWSKLSAFSSFAFFFIAAALAAAITGCGSDSPQTLGTGGGGAADGGGGGSPDDGGAAPSNDAAQLCVDTINHYRATLGLAPYVRWTAEESCTGGEAQSDSMSGQAHGAFGNCSEFAQDECPGWDGPPETMITKCLAMMWAEGPGGGHYENMRGNYTNAACGFYTTPDGKVWAVQNFR